MENLYVSSEDERAEYPHFYKTSLARLKREQRRLSKMKKGGSNCRKQKMKIARLHEKITNQRKEFLHKKSRQIANAYDLVCIEDLDMKGMSRSPRFGMSVHDNKWMGNVHNTVTAQTGRYGETTYQNRQMVCEQSDMSYMWI